VQPALGDPAWAEGWAGWPTEGPSNPKLAVILWVAVGTCGMDPAWAGPETLGAGGCLGITGCPVGALAARGWWPPDPPWATCASLRMHLSKSWRSSRSRPAREGCPCAWERWVGVRRWWVTRRSWFKEVRPKVNENRSQKWKCRELGAALVGISHAAAASPLSAPGGMLPGKETATGKAASPAGSYGPMDGATGRDTLTRPMATRPFPPAQRRGCSCCQQPGLTPAVCPLGVLRWLIGLSSNPRLCPLCQAGGGS